MLTVPIEGIDQTSFGKILKATTTIISGSYSLIWFKKLLLLKSFGWIKSILLLITYIIGLYTINLL